jgi:hypothetical protein
VVVVVVVVVVMMMMMTMTEGTREYDIAQKLINKGAS